MRFGFNFDLLLFEEDFPDTFFLRYAQNEKKKEEQNVELSTNSCFLYVINRSSFDNLRKKFVSSSGKSNFNFRKKLLECFVYLEFSKFEIFLNQQTLLEISV